MTEEIFESIKKKSEEFQYTSLHYTDYEDVNDYEIVSNDRGLILLHGCEHEFREPYWQWACDSADLLLKKIIASQKEGMVPFVPKGWVGCFEAEGFAVREIWKDYFNPDLSGWAWDETTEFLAADQCQEASDVTLSCKGLSRGFTGQTAKWVRDWIAGEDKDAKAIFRRCGGVIAGVVFVTVYGRESAKGPILWVREIAVRPEYQRRGVASALLRQALGYGKKCGATRAFLAADELNSGAIRIYERFGFAAAKGDGQIDMQRG